MNKLNSFSLSLVVPAFNEEEIIEESVEIFWKDLKKLGPPFEIIIVDDGSTDRTGKIADKLAKDYKEIKVVHHSVNRGSGAGLVTGFKEAKGDWVLTNCADRPFDIKDLRKILPLLQNTDAVVVVRESRAANIFFRKLTSLLNYWLIRLLFRVNISDFQFVQLYRRKILKNIEIDSSETFVAPEIIIKVITAGYRIKEFKTKFHKRPGGKAKYNNPRRYLRSIKEILSFWLKWYIMGERKRYKLRRKV